ncbi:hypothetical protein EIK77_000221 [Talaromyces pinophilus]|nr:hypothetical protein EIK77_000221 [Talaromyces pinophilus]
MPSQTVFRLAHRNGFDAFEPRTEAIPTIDRHELLIKVRSVALNYRDVAIATSKYPFPTKDDLIPCSDAMGEVAEVGSSVEGFEQGDKVVIAFDPTAQYGTIDNWNHALGGPTDGVLSQYVRISYTGAVKVPPESTLKDEQWAALVCTGATAWNSLFGNVSGTGGVSVTGLVLAKALGAKTIITSSSDDKLRYVQEKFGADYLINYKKTPDWATEAKKLTGGNGIDYILENGGSGTIKQSIEAIKFGGVISVIGFLSQAPQDEMPDVAGLALSKGCVVRGIIIGSKQLLEEVVQFVGAQNLEIPVEKTFDFTKDGVVKALEFMTSGNHIGKVCIRL